MLFKGISPEGIYLLAENRFNDSKTFYELNKAKINELTVHQMRALLDDLFDTLVEINPNFILDPVRCVSRVRRDTRYTHDKSLYRENLWLMIRHQKNFLPTPCFWFEFFPEGYTYGCGIISATPTFMANWRQAIKSNPERIEATVQTALDAGFALDGECYKRSKAEADGITGLAAKLYDLKSPFISHTVKGIANLNKPKKLEKELIDGFKALTPFYDYCLTLTENFNCE